VCTSTCHFLSISKCYLDCIFPCSRYCGAGSLSLLLCSSITLDFPGCSILDPPVGWTHDVRTFFCSEVQRCGAGMSPAGFQRHSSFVCPILQASSNQPRREVAMKNATTPNQQRQHKALTRNDNRTPWTTRTHGSNRCELTELQRDVASELVGLVDRSSQLLQRARPRGIATALQPAGHCDRCRKLVPPCGVAFEQ